MVRYIGLDVHKRVVEVCAVDRTGKRLFRTSLACTKEALTEFGTTTLTKEDQVALEATTNTWAVAAQHLDSHPGPLGAFFRRVAKKKNRNVAVIAAARKLVTIAVLMLKNNEPYRYALPVPTQKKLGSLRFTATGNHLKAEPIPIVRWAQKPKPGERTENIRSLPDIYRREGLPAAQTEERLGKGEQRVLRECKAMGFFRSIQSPQQRLRPTRKGKPQDAGVEGAERTRT